MPEIQTKDKLITLEELGVAINNKAGVTSVNNQTGAVSVTPANIGALPNSIVKEIATSSDWLYFPYTNDSGNDRIFLINDSGITLADSGWNAIWNMPTVPISIGDGGTGATTPAQARVNLELTPSTPQTIAAGIQIAKIGNLAFINCDGGNVVALPPATWVTLGYLPNGYVPTGHFYGTFSNGGMAQQTGLMHITESGTVQYFNGGSAQQTALWGSMTFPISNN